MEIEMLYYHIILILQIELYILQIELYILPIVTN